jgi:hypothetical protein
VPTLLRFAQRFAAAYPLFPCAPDTKRPRVKFGSQTTQDEHTINEWWQHWPDSWIGLPTGLRSSLVVLDIDVKDGKDGFADLETLCAGRALPDCPVVQTASGGAHLYFRHFHGARNSKGRLAPGLDVRGEGGFVVAPFPPYALAGDVLDDPLEEAARVVEALRSAPECPEWLQTLVLENSARTPDALPAEDDPYAGKRRALTRDELVMAAARARNAERGRLIGQVAAGLAWGARGGRSTTLFDLCYELGLQHPDLDPWATADLFSASCAAVVTEDADVRGAEETTVAWVAQTLQRAATIYAVPRLAREAALEIEARAAFGLPEPDAVDARPEIRIGPNLHTVVDAACSSLASAPELYQRDGRLVRVLRVAGVDTAKARASEGTPQIREVQMATLRELLTRAAQFVRWDQRSGGWRPTHPPDPVVAAVLSRGVWPGVRPLVGLIETPSMRPDGSVLDVPGYDGATGYLYTPSTPFGGVPSSPTLGDAKEALSALSEPWADFPVSSEPERYVAIAAALTLIARPAVRGATPAFLFDASTRGSGKSLSARCATAIAQGREAALLSWPTDPAELEKVLGACALAGASVVCFDNVATEFGGAPLDKVLTCTDRVQLRVLGQSMAPELAWRGVLIAGGNNLMLGGDTTRRVLVCRLEPMTERPEERTDYRLPDVAGWCREQHPRLVVAGLTLLRAYVLAGRPAQGLRAWGGFEAWADLIAGALHWAGGIDIMACRPTVVGRDDGETGALRTIIDELPALAPDGISPSALIELLWPASGIRREGPPAHARLREAIDALVPSRAGLAPSARSLGRGLAKHRRRVVGAAYLDSSRPAGIAVWRVFRVR